MLVAQIVGMAEFLEFSANDLPCFGGAMVKAWYILRQLVDDELMRSIPVVGSLNLNTIPSESANE